MSPENSVLVLLSGGLDSTVLLHHVRRELDKQVIALSFNYGQRHIRELRCAAAQVKAAGASGHIILDISFMSNLLREASALIEGGNPVPALSQLDAEALRQPPTYVPNRNMMLLSMAAACAEARGLQQVYYGAQAQDEYGYWDCTKEFLERINALLALNRRTAVTIEAPFIDWSKKEILERGQELRVDLAQTWSCYRGENMPCQSCPTCIERANAFNALNLKDPLLTLQPQ